MAAGVIAGKRSAALPAPMSRLASPFRFGRGPSGNVGGGVALGEAVPDWVAEVTVVVSSAAGGVHFSVVTTRAVAVSFTELTDFAPDATAICAFRLAGVFSETELTAQEAVPLPLPQPLVNWGFWLDGCEVRVTDTPEADPFCAETLTT
jgi:hypothetical protein